MAKLVHQDSKSLDIVELYGAIHRTRNEEQRLPDLSLGNLLANTINPRSPSHSSPDLA